MKFQLVAALMIVSAAAWVGAASPGSLRSGAVLSSGLRHSRYFASAVPPAPSAVVRFTLALRHTERQLERLRGAALNISDPAHADYRARQPYTNAELAAIVGASAAKLGAVRAFVAGDLRGRVVSVGNHRDSVVVEAPVAAVEAAFGVRVAAFAREGDAGAPVLRATSSPQVPLRMAAHVAMVAGLSAAELHAADSAKARGQARKARGAAAPREAVAGAPTLLASVGGGDFVYAPVTPVCADGSASQSTDVLCSGQGPAITAFRLAFQTIGFDNQPVGAVFTRDVPAGGMQPAPPTGNVGPLSAATSQAQAPATANSGSRLAAGPSTCPYPDTLATCLQAATMLGCPGAANYAATGLGGAPCHCVKAWIDCQLGATCQDSGAVPTPAAQCAAYADQNPVCGVSCTGFNPVLPVPGAMVSQCATYNDYGVVCNPYVFRLPKMTLFNVSVAAVYADGTVSPQSPQALNTVLTTPYLEPRVVRELYGVPSKLVGTGSRIVQGVAEFSSQYYYPPDYTTFLQHAGLPVPAVTVMGGNDPLASGGESSLDIQWIAGIGAGVANVFDYLSGNAFVFEWAQQLVDAPARVADVWSISYGLEEGQYNAANGFPPGYIARSEVELAKLAAKRVTVVISAGDNGASDFPNAPTCAPLHPNYPSSSAWVTSLGSSFLTPYSTPACATDPAACVVGEAYVRNFDASGIFWSAGSGFSTTQPQQPWQAEVVQTYLSSYASTLPPTSVWNPSGRAYPDVATIGHNLVSFQNLVPGPVDGTSASAPIFAGLVSLLAVEMAAQGLPPPGFLNPLLYSCGPQCFNDVTVGNSRGAVHADVCPFGFQATPGWDATSGLGTPRFPALLQKALGQSL